jgi:predicted transporter
VFILLKNYYYKSKIKNNKNIIQKAQTTVILSANKELIKLYWLIGQIIVEKAKRKYMGQ